MEGVIFQLFSLAHGIEPMTEDCAVQASRMWVKVEVTIGELRRRAGAESDVGAGAGPSIDLIGIASV